MKSLESRINDFVTGTDVVCHGENMLSRMQSLVDALGNPEKKLKVIHVAGTSGKTSTCYFVASLLKAAGQKVGLTVSPHIDTVRERAMFDLAPLLETEWTEEMTEYLKIVQDSGVKPSYFEFYMGFAFWLFVKKQADYVVVETGLGGKWDGSNVITSSDKVCVITDIGFDHTEILGEDITTIATEKAGIIHEKNTVFMYEQPLEITSVIKKQAKITNATLETLNQDVITSFFDRNLFLAQKTVEFILARDHQPALIPAQIAQARSVIIPARAEEIKHKHKTIIMDGSHNPQKLTAFKQHLEQKYGSKPRTLIATLGSNKEATLLESMKILRELSDEIILTSFENDSPETHKRTSIQSDLLQSAAKNSGFKKITYLKSPQAALARALENPAEQIVITGSFYLLNHLRPTLLED